MSQYPPEYQYPQQQYGYPPQQDWYGAQAEPKPSGVMGWVSIALAALALVIGAVAIGAAVALVGPNPGAIDQQNPPPELLLVGCSVWLSPLLALIGAIVGAIALFLPSQNKVLAGIGLGICGMMMCSCLGLIVIGVAMQSAGFQP